MNALTVLTSEAGLMTGNILDMLIASFINSQDVKQASRDTYLKSLRAFKGWLSGQGIRNPVRQDILAYKDFQQAQGLSCSTVSGYMVVVRKFFEYLEATFGYQNVAKGIKGGKRAKGFRKDPLTVEQIKDLLDKINRATIQGVRDYAMLNLMIRTELRTIDPKNAVKLW